ncbi:MAG TPA: DUF4405 domain-containing protein [Methanosarcinales archaeon]|nr:DUF4405 domain-containing protein [Methanosarcinales archaeon]
MRTKFLRTSFIRYFFGWIALFCFIVSAITGVILDLYYVPIPEKAPTRIFFIMDYVLGGYIIRIIHRWSAYFMVFMVILHILHLYYKDIICIILLIITLIFFFSGYILPNDQTPYWIHYFHTIVVSIITIIIIIMHLSKFPIFFQLK